MSDLSKRPFLYQPFGLPSYGTIMCKFRFVKPNDTVTINGDVYTFPLNFGGLNNASTGLSIALSLAAVINGDPSNQINGIQTLVCPNARAYQAHVISDVVFIYATQPGVLGNLITLATSNANAFVLSGNTLANGANAPSGINLFTSSQFNLANSTFITPLTSAASAFPVTGFGAPATSGASNYITGFQAFNSHATNGTLIGFGSYLAGSLTTTPFTGYLPALCANSIQVQFNSPIKLAANTGLGIQIGTAANIYYSFQGYSGI